MRIIREAVFGILMSIVDMTICILTRVVERQNIILALFVSKVLILFLETIVFIPLKNNRIHGLVIQIFQADATHNLRIHEVMAASIMLTITYVQKVGTLALLGIIRPLRNFQSMVRMQQYVRNADAKVILNEKQR